jgi:hypothetical protein
VPGQAALWLLGGQPVICHPVTATVGVLISRITAVTTNRLV